MEKEKIVISSKVRITLDELIDVLYYKEYFNLFDLELPK